MIGVIACAFRNPSQHSRTNLFVVVDANPKSGRAGRSSVRCEPDCRLMLQPILERAADSAGFADGQLLKRPGM